MVDGETSVEEWSQLTLVERSGEYSLDSPFLLGVHLVEDIGATRRWSMRQWADHVGVERGVPRSDVKPGAQPPPAIINGHYGVSNPMGKRLTPVRLGLRARCLGGFGEHRLISGLLAFRDGRPIYDSSSIHRAQNWARPPGVSGAPKSSSTRYPTGRLGGSSDHGGTARSAR